MKTSALIALLLAASTVFSANYDSTPETLDCRKYLANFAPNLTASQLVEQDLLNGTWYQQTATGSLRKYQFNSNGEANLLEQDNEGNLRMTELQWSVEEWDGKAVLTTNETGRYVESHLQVEQTCDGLNLINLSDGSTTILTYKPQLKAAQWDALKASLEGEWTNVSWSNSAESCGNMEEKEGAFLNFCFKTDGTYKMTCGNSKKKMEARGTWELSKDGQFIFFHCENDLPKVAKIARMDEHGLVLEHSMNAPGFGDFFCADLHSFTFIK